MIRRRNFLRAAGAGGLLALPNAAWANVTKIAAPPADANDLTILAGGPPGGRIDRWSRATAQALIGGFAAHTAIRVETVGGLDGVSAANRSQNLVVPNGRTATMLPGTAAIAFLTNDPRVHFQPDDFVPVLGGLNPLVLVVRGGLQRLSSSTPLRFAAASPESGDLAGLLGLARLGVPVAPVFGLNGTGAKSRAFADKQADALLLFGEGVAEDVAPLTAEGGIAICTLGLSGPDASANRIDAIAPFNHLPSLDALVAARGGSALSKPLDQAYRALVCVGAIDFMLLLPHLTAPTSIALWRYASAQAIKQPVMQEAASASDVKLIAGINAAAAVAPLATGADALLALNRYLATQYGWHR